MIKDTTSEHLRTELKSLADTLEEVLRGSSQKPKAEFEKLRSKAESALKETRTRLGDGSERLAEQTKIVADRADEYVHENPWVGIGIGAVAGFILGAIITRR
ncbi:DUF883 family protein [Biostraticola tofi]|uniref:ElaB/YqjD/DUF883 family membrane-anchored ribosome-binding protein n=1 Tax=Biostraticola tofi TaxID=466109 RepID=A0A4R3Z3C7_9GAMM|nr:YqjD family protein [Biostraticola tofi]TCV98803.1 ElaB/YqjD/DUF883 family membrane-anchored ribosome-binding protein [Biostraticola tofi]